MTYDNRRQHLTQLLSWTPYGPKDVAEAIGSERSQVSAVLHGHKTSAPMLDRVQDFLWEVRHQQPDLESELMGMRDE